MTTDHTPGPWFLGINGKIWRRPPSDLYEHGGGVAGDHPVAQAFRGHPGWEQGFPFAANARLIAAAPDLLLALERVTSSYYALLGRAPVRDAAETLAEAHAAIAKARGSQ